MPNADGRARSRTRRFYRALLRLLPFEFRAEFGRDMEQTFSDEQEDLLTRRNRTQVFRFWLRTLADFARTAPREQWDILRQDVRAGARVLARSPGFAITAILTLALGIAGSTSIFSVVYAVVLRPLSFPQSERVVHVGWGTAEKGAAVPRPVSFPDFQTLRDTCRSFELIAAMQHDSLSSDQGALNVRLPSTESMGGVGPSYVTPMMASASLFKLVGASPVLGRLFDERDEKPGEPPVAVLSYSTWNSVYRRDAGVIGRTLVRHVGGGRQKSVTIVGVLAADALKGLWYDFPEPPAVTSLDTDMMRIRDDAGRESFTPSLGVYARLADRVALDAARAELTVLTPYLTPGLPKTSAFSKAALRANHLRDELVEDVRAPLVAFLCAVLGLLLVACVNVSSLVLARSISRRHEFAARFALGARPFRVARQLLTESAILAASGGIVGVALAWAGWRAFMAISPSMPRLNESRIGAPALLFALGAVLIATCTSALVPAFLSSRRSVVDGLRRVGGAASAGTGFSRPLALLAAAEITVVFVLLAGTGLLVNSFARLVVFDLGFDARSILMVTITHRLPDEGSSRPTPRGDQQESVAVLSARQRVAAAIGDEITQRVAAIPGVAAVGLTGDDPFGPPYRYGDLQIGEDGPVVDADRRLASPTALEALGLHLLGGRWFTKDDREGRPLVAVVNQTMVQRCWNGRSPIGDTFLSGRRTLQVVGVVADVRTFGTRKEAKPTFYVSTTQIYPDPVMLVVRKRPGAAGVESLVGKELARVGTRIQAGGSRQLEHIWWRQLSDARFLTLVVSVFSLLALAVALVGVHGVLRFSVAQRTREMGIRKALGAADSALVALVVAQALRFTLPACLVGLLGAWAVAPAIRSLLFGITPTDPVTMVTAAALLVAAVVLAAYFPARRASAVDPSLSLRCE